jgi:hypothetical protein
MATKKTTRKYSPAAGADVEREMKAMQEGKLTSGRSGKKVTNPKQAIAIGLSDARKEGKKVPPPPAKSAAKKSSSKKAPGKNTAAKKAPAKKTAAKKSA